MSELFFFEITGFSMWPFLKSGERLIVKKVLIKDLKPGDIILYRVDNNLVCHRLIRKIKERDGYLLYARGDNSLSSPELVTEKMLLGKTIGIVKNNRTTDLTKVDRQFINRFIVMIAPLVSLGIRIFKIFLEKDERYIPYRKS